MPVAQSRPKSPAGTATMLVTRFHVVHGLLVVLATAVAAALRLQDLGTWSFWVDEAHSWRDATMALDGENGFLSEDRRLYPLTFLLLRVLIDVGGLAQDEWSLRLPFALIGIATVPLLAVCGRHVIGPGAAVLSAWLLALHPWHVFWSQNARGYALVVFGAVIAADRVRAFTQHYRRRDAVALGAAVLLAVTSHPTGALLAVAVVAAFLVRQALRWRWTTQLFAAVVMLLLLWWGPAVAGQFFPDFMRSKQGNSTDHFLRTSVFYFRPALLLLALVGGALLVSRARLGRLLLGCFALAPFVVMLPMSHEVKVTARFAICALPAMVWLAAAACVEVGRAVLASARLPAHSRLLAAALLPALFAGELVQQLGEYYTVQHGQRGQWRRAAEVLRERTQGASLRVLTVNQPTMLYYLRPGHYSSEVAENDQRTQVMPLIRWMWEQGRDRPDKNAPLVHEPGVANHFGWHAKMATASQTRFAVVVTMPELIEEDRSSEFRVYLADHFELVAYLPCWIGPKDESIYIYLPKRT